MMQISKEAAVERCNTLSAREREVLALLITEHLPQQVAVELGISALTVANHESSIYQKLRARSLGDLLKITIASEMFSEELESCHTRPRC